MPVASVALKTMSLPEFGEPTVMPLVERPHEARIPAFLPPFWLSRNSAMAVARR